eukprot:9366248-Pyramimonas_sp.AAC.1
MTARIRSLAREPHVKTWAAESEPMWDAAITGNAAPCEAFRRVCEEGVSGVLGSSTGHGLLDIQGFYDAMEWFYLIPAALRLGHPPIMFSSRAAPVHSAEDAGT